MRKTGFTLLSASVVLTTLAVANSALAQDPAAPPAVPPAAAAPEDPPAEAAPPPPPPAPVEDAPPPPPPEAAAPPPPPEALPPPPPPEEPAPPTPTITGFVEGAYHRNLTDPHNVRTPGTHAYDTNNSFLLHMAHVALNHSFTEWASGTIEIDGGTDAVVNSGGDSFDLQEAYATLSAPFGLSVVAGKFATYEGIELIEGPLNPTITRGFLYVLAEPVTHTGVKVHYDFQGMVNVGVGLVNGWDVVNDNNDGKTFIWRVGTAPIPEFFAGFSGTYGPENAGNEDSKRLSLDLTGGVVVGPLTINFQGNYGSESEAIGDDSASWLGFGLQPVVSLDNGFSLGARFEYFADSDGYRAGVDDTNYMNFTIVPGYTIDGWTVRGEYRLDTASEDVFVESDGVSLAGNQSTMAIGVHYVF